MKATTTDKIFIQRGLIFVICALLCSCGWHLRGLNNSPLPEEIKVIAKDRYSPMIAIFAENLRNFGVTSSEEAQIHLVLGLEKLEKRTVAVSSIGTAAQYEIRMSVPYQFRNITAQDAGAMILSESPVAISTRVFDFETGTNLSKTQEENLLLSEMRHEIARYIIQESRRHVSGNQLNTNNSPSS